MSAAHPPGRFARSRDCVRLELLAIGQDKQKRTQREAQAREVRESARGGLAGLH